MTIYELLICGEEMCELSIQIFIQKMKCEKGSITKLLTKSKHWNYITFYINDVWRVRDWQFHV